MLLGVLVMGGCYLAFALSSFFWLAVAFLVVGSVGRMLFMVTNNTVIQARVPDAYRGRVMSVLMMSFGTMPLGVLPLTIAADALGPQVAVAALSVLVLITMLSAFVFSTTLRNLRLTPLEERDLSPAQAARMVAEGELTQQEADAHLREHARELVDILERDTALAPSMEAAPFPHFAAALT